MTGYCDDCGNTLCICGPDGLPPVARTESTGWNWKKVAVAFGGMMMMAEVPMYDSQVANAVIIAVNALGAGLFGFACYSAGLDATGPSPRR